MPDVSERAMLAHTLNKLARKQKKDTRKARGKEPEKFDEKTMCIKNWIVSVEAYLSSYEGITQDEMVKFTLTYLEGDVSKLFAEQCYDLVVNNQYRRYLEYWSEFKDKLIELFDDKNAALKAEIASEKLRVGDRKSTRLNSSHSGESRMPSSA